MRFLLIILIGIVVLFFSCATKNRQTTVTIIESTHQPAPVEESDPDKITEEPVPTVPTETKETVVWQKPAGWKHVRGIEELDCGSHLSNAPEAVKAFKNGFYLSGWIDIEENGEMVSRNFRCFVDKDGFSFDVEYTNQSEIDADAVIETQDGFYYTSTQVEESRNVIRKLNSSGEELWSFVIEDEGYFKGENIIKLVSGNLFWLGRRYVGSTDSSFKELVVFNADGELLGKSRLGGKVYPEIYASLSLEDGSVILSGHFEGETKGPVCYRISGTGVILWTLDFENTSGGSLSAMALDKEGFIIGAGSIAEPLEFAPKYYFHLVKITQNGELVLEKRFDGDLKLRQTELLCLQAKGGYVIGGTRNTSPERMELSFWQPCLLFLDKEGNFKRDVSFRNGAWLRDLCELNNGSLVAACELIDEQTDISNTLVVRMDPYLVEK